MSKGELVNYIQVKAHKYDGDAHTTLTLWRTAAKYASCKTGIFYPSDFQWFGNTRWLKCTNYLTVNFQQGFLPHMKIILLTNSLEQDIDILTSEHLQNVSHSIII